MADIEYALQLIDETVDSVIPRCFQCGTQLRPNGPSLDFCGDMCQQAWHQKRAADPMPSRGLRLHIRETDNSYLSPEAYHRAWERYRSTRPPGLFESLWNLIRPWRKHV